MKQEIELKEGMTARIEGGKVVIEMAEFEPKDGDFLYWENGVVSGIIILEGRFEYGGEYATKYYAHIAKSGTLYIGHRIGNMDKKAKKPYFRFATESEKQTLLDALAKEGMRWNAELKQIEDLPLWRAKIGETYYTICFGANGGVVVRLTERRDSTDDALFESGNYFKTEADVPVEAFQKVYDEFFAKYKNQTK
jgi:hypothetical protein